MTVMITLGQNKKQTKEKGFFFETAFKRDTKNNKTIEKCGIIKRRTFPNQQTRIRIGINNYKY